LSLADVGFLQFSRVVSGDEMANPDFVRTPFVVASICSVTFSRRRPWYTLAKKAGGEDVGPQEPRLPRLFSWSLGSEVQSFWPFFVFEKISLTTSYN